MTHLNNSYSLVGKTLKGLLVVLAIGLFTGCLPDKSSNSGHTEPHADGVERTYTLDARITGYVGVGGEIDGVKNPTLKANKGDTVKITIINKEDMAHDIALVSEPSNKSEAVMKIGEKTTFEFVAQGNDEYFCTIPGHLQAGMIGKIEVDGAGPAVAEKNTSHTMGASAKPLSEAKPVSVKEIGQDAAAVPPPIERRTASTVEFTIRTTEVVAELEDGTTFDLWTFDDKVPGPMLRVREGDSVVIHVDNDPDSSMVHSIDFHSVTGPGGGAYMLQVPPGERRSIQFKATHAGLFVYHCATPHIPTHLARGMFGLILVEPADGLPEVDREYYVMQGEYFTTARPGTKGHQTEDADRLFEEQPTYVVFNGRVGSLTGDRALKANVGETVRIYFGVGGPNTISSFHVIGEIFDRVYREGALLDPPGRNIQTTLVPPGGASMVEFKVDYPGKYLLVDHALSRLDKGAVGILEVEGEKDLEILQGLK